MESIHPMDGLIDLEGRGCLGPDLGKVVSVKYGPESIGYTKLTEYFLILVSVS